MFFGVKLIYFSAISYYGTIMISEEDLKKMGETFASLAKILAQIGIPATAAAVMTRYGLPKIEEMFKKGKSEKEVLEELVKVIKSSPEYQRSLESDYERMAREAFSRNPEILLKLKEQMAPSVATREQTALPALPRQVPPEVEIEKKALSDKLTQLYQELNRIDIDHLAGRMKDEEYQLVKTRISQAVEETKSRLRTVDATWR
ncbi:MAG: hypothetical protein QW385_00685 [Thermoproteota archaeon]